MGKDRGSSTPIIAIVSSIVLLSAIGALWLTVFRESARKELLLEYEAYRTSAELLDEFRRDRSSIPSGDKRLLGFGIYGLDGNSIALYGKAPARYLAARLPEQPISPPGPDQRASPGLGNLESRFSPDSKSIVLVRFSGPQGQRGMMGMGQGQGQGRNGSINGPYYVWIEYAAEGYFAERMQFILVAAIVTAALVGLFLVLLRFAYRNESMRLKEIETRELVQLGEAARTLVHEIKNPLGIMRIQTSRLRRSSSGLEEKKKALFADSADIIESEIQRLSAMADRIREFLKSGPVELGSVELKSFLLSYAARYEALKELGTEISLDLPTVDEAYAVCDPERLVTALDNLITNSLEAMRGSSAAGGKIAIRLYNKNALWCISVTDSGPGVAKDLRARIFDPFFTTKEKGSGIGLSLARRIADSFGGNLVHEEGPGGGATFVISLKPAAIPESRS
jgi:signal transduction histidine kinase